MELTPPFCSCTFNMHGNQRVFILFLSKSQVSFYANKETRLFSALIKWTYTVPFCAHSFGKVRNADKRARERDNWLLTFFCSLLSCICLHLQTVIRQCGINPKMRLYWNRWKWIISCKKRKNNNRIINCGHLKATLIHTHSN